MTSGAGQRRMTLALAVLTVLALSLSVPASLRDAWERGGFVLQPAIAISLGIAAGRSDGRAGRPPYLLALLLGREDRVELVKSAYQSIAHVVLAGILVDSVCQWLILGTAYPGAALVVGPVLIAFPYAAARALANRVASGHAGRLLR